MNTLLICFIALIIVCVTIVFFGYKFTFEKKFLNLKEWSMIGVGLLLMTLCYFTYDTGNKVNSKMNVVVNIPREFISEHDSVSDLRLNDTILFNYLINMKVNNPEIILVQAKIESANYKSGLFNSNFNLFGMKTSVNRQTLNSGSKGQYQSYGKWQDSVVDYVLWMNHNGLDKFDQNGYLAYLGKHYAEDPNYVTKLRSELKRINFENLKY